MKTKLHLFAFGAVLLLSGCGTSSTSAIRTFEECAAAGNPVMESYPRQCRTSDGTLFVESVSSAGQSSAAVSDRGNIRVTLPVANQLVVSPLLVRGEARVFENVFQYRIKDANGNVVVEGHASASSPDVGVFGPFAVQVPFTAPSTDTGTVDVFVYSAKDGSEEDMVSIPVRFRP